MNANRRYIIFGAGAIGGVVGGCLHQTGFPVHLIARGPHLEAIATDGLTIHRPSGPAVLKIPASATPADAQLTGDDIVILAMKSQHTLSALEALEATAPPDITVVCAQNGVTNERLALRRFANVYAMNVTMPASHLQPGVVVGEGTPIAGVLDIGRYPSGVDETATEIAAALSASDISSEALPNIMAYKYAKLRLNTVNAIDAVCGRGERQQELARLAKAEALAVYRAASIEVASSDQVRQRRGNLQISEVAGHPRGGSSSWQSLARTTGSIEVDYLGGEIVLLGRLHRVPTPVNLVATTLAKQLAATGQPPGSIDVATVEDLVAKAST